MNINAVVDYAVDAGVAVITVDSPPVNALSAPVRAGIYRGVETAAADAAVGAIVLICAGRTFFAGADITEFGKPPVSPLLQDLQALIENAPKPVVAAIHGTALGGGLELALVAHYRIAVPAASCGLPEVDIGLIPGAGGSQRLPRVVGVEAALEMITSARHVPAAQAHAMGLLDVLAQGPDLRAEAVAFARRVVAEGRALPRVRELDAKLEAARAAPGLFAQFRAGHARRFRGFLAPEYAIRAVEAAVNLPFDAGIAEEKRLFRELLDGSQSAAQRHAFFAERRAAKVPGIPADAPTRTIARVGVIGAGTMGGGIAMNFLSAGIPVVLVETSREALDRGIGVMRGNYESSAKRCARTWRSRRKSSPNSTRLPSPARSSPATPPISTSTRLPPAPRVRRMCSACISSRRRTSCGCWRSCAGALPRSM